VGDARPEVFAPTVKKNPCPPACALGLTECSLDCLARGQKGRVCGVHGPNRQRLLELGFTQGIEVEVSRRAAFGGPLEVRLRSYRLSLRRDEAGAIRVETGS
jgi:ferrous iron transport protein A